MRILSVIVMISLLAAAPAFAADDAVIEGMQEYMEFTSYADGALSAEQLRQGGLDNVVIVDVRNDEQFLASHIAGAIHIEWRQILARRDELPADRTLLLYCDTGLLSAKAQFALRIAGFDKAKVLLGGYPAWIAATANAAPRPGTAAD